MAADVVSVLSTLYRVGLVFLPARFRAAHGRELRVLVRERVRDARVQGGARAAAGVFLRELSDVLATALRLRAQRTRPVNMPRRQRGFRPDDLLRELRM